MYLSKIRVACNKESTKRLFIQTDNIKFQPSQYGLDFVGPVVEELHS